MVSLKKFLMFFTSSRSISRNRTVTKQGSEMLFNTRGKTVIRSLLSVTLIVASLGVSVGMFSSVAQAEEDEKKYGDVKTKQRHAVGKACAKRLEGVQEVVGGDKEPTKQQLQDLARKLPGYMSKDCATSYEKSNVYNMLGFIHYSLDNYDGALDAYLKLIREPDADDRQRLSTRYTVAQLYMLQEKYAEAVKQLEAWMKEATVIGDSARILLAQAYYQVNRKDDALKIVNKVIADSEANGQLPKESWWSLQRVLYYEKEDYGRVTEILKKLVTHYPSLNYWKQLGGMYAQLEKDMNQLVSTEVVYLQKGLTQERQLLTLAYLYLGAGAPYRAALLIENGMKQDIIEESAKNLELLGSVWQQAQSTDKAAVVLERAAKLSGKGEIYARLAGVYLDQDESVKAARAAKNALSKGGLKRPELTHLALGSAYVNLHCYGDAVKSFRQSAKYDKTKKASNQWIAYATAEGDRRTKLISAGAKISGCTKV